MYPTTYRAIANLVRGAVTETPVARKVMRKSGFEPGSASPPAPPEGPVLTIPPVVVAGGCPREPMPPDFAGLPEGEAEDFYEAVAAAEAGEPGSLAAFRDILDDLGYGGGGTEEEPETVRVNGGCPVEADLVFIEDAPFFEVIAVRMNGRRGPISAGTYWHPLNLGGYVTKWNFAASSEVRTHAAVAEGADATVRPVYAVTYADLIAGDWDYLTSGIDCSSSGFFKTTWGATPTDQDVFVAFVMEIGSSVSSFSMGACEVRAR